MIFRFASTSATNADDKTRDPVVPLPGFLAKKVPRDMETATNGLPKRVMKVKGH